MSNVVTLPFRLTDQLAKEFFVHKDDADGNIWLQSGGFYPNGEPMLFLVHMDETGRATVEDRGVTLTFLNRQVQEDRHLSMKKQKQLSLYGVFLDPVTGAFQLRVHRGKIADGVHRLRLAIDALLSGKMGKA